MKIICFWLLPMVCWLVAGAAEVPLRNGGFEDDPVNGFPPGWQLWGHDAKRERSDFTVDEAVSRSGKRSLRILHPQAAKGYIVTAVRDNLIPVQSNRVYEIAFFARTDRPGEASVHVEGQQKENPQGARTVLGQPFQVGVAWQRFSFTVTEGATLFIDEFSHLMLAIHATAQHEPQPTRTLWIDDVTVEERLVPRDAVRLLNPRSLSYEPLQHRLKTGDTLDVMVHADRTLRKTTRLAGGVSFHRASGYMGLPYSREGEYRLTPWQEDAIRGLRLPFTRFYAVGDETYPLEQSLDKIVTVLARCEIPQRETVLEFETQGAATKLSPDVWARGVKYSLDKG